MKKYILLLSLFVLSACQENNINMTTDTLQQWFFITGKDHGKILKPIADHQITLQILPQRFVGSAGVNHYQISAQILKDKIIKISDQDAMTTRMAGNIQAMKMEYLYLQALRKVDKMRMEDNKLILSGDKIKLVFQQ